MHLPVSLIFVDKYVDDTLIIFRKISYSIYITYNELIEDISMSTTYNNNHTYVIFNQWRLRDRIGDRPNMATFANIFILVSRLIQFMRYHVYIYIGRYGILLCPDLCCKYVMGFVRLRLLNADTFKSEFRI